MTLIDFLSQVTRITFIALAAITLADLLRRRTRTQLDIALLFGSLGLTVIAQQFAGLTGQQPLWLVKVMQISLMAHPCLLLQLVDHFRPVPAGVRWFAGLGLIASAAGLLSFEPLPPAFRVALVVYFACIELYAVGAFIRGALTTAGVTHWRLRLIAVGSALLALVIILAGINIIFPALASYTALLSQALGTLSALSYYAGFSPPRWLRRAWQLGELHRFLREAASTPAAERGEKTLQRLCASAVRAVGGRAAVASLWDETDQQLIIRASTDPALSGCLSARQGVSGRAWQTGQPAYSRNPGELAPESARLAARLGARAVLAAQIATVERGRGLLLVLLRHGPLFPEDDLDLLELFAEQSALALEQTELLNAQNEILVEQQNLVAQLSQRTVQLEEANQELEAFSYSVSHDLRAPLRHIEGFTDLLFKTGVVGADDKNRRYLTLIAEAAARMGQLIDNLLTFSRLGRAGLAVTLVDLRGLVEEVQHDLQVEMEGRDITWKIGPLPRVHGDPALLRMVWINLLSNALKYTRPRARAQIEIECLPDRSQGAVLCVRDNGVGFDMQYADKLFGVFQRLHHHNEFEGTGIGLANVRRIIQRHGGRTWAEGVLDGGATFYFSFPNVAPVSTSPVMTREPAGTAAFPFASTAPGPDPPAAGPPLE